MPDTNAATPQPAVVATPQQPSGETVTKTGSGNLTSAQAVQRFLRHEEARQQTANAAETVATTTQAATPAAPEQTPAAEEANPSSPKPEDAAETPAPAEAETESDGEEVPSHENSQSGLPPEIQKKLDRRIGKEVAKRKQLEARVGELQAMLLQVKPAAQATPEAQHAAQVVPLPTGAPPLANVNDIQGLVALQQQAKEAKRWAEEQLDREDIQNGIQLGDRTLSKADILGIRRRASITLEDEIPARANFLQARNQSEQTAFERYPFLKDAAAPEYLMAQQALTTYPWLKNIPNHMEIVGRQILGAKYEAMLAEQVKAKTTGAKPARPTPRPTGGQTEISADAGQPRVPHATLNRQQAAESEKGFMAKKGLTSADARALLVQRELQRQQSR